MNKYTLIESDVKKLHGWKLYRIKALKDFGHVKKGELGGYIQGYYNLSQDNNCWISPDSSVYGNALIKNNAKITGKSRVYDRTIIGGDSIIENSNIHGTAKIAGKSYINTSMISGTSVILDSFVGRRSNISSSVIRNSTILNALLQNVLLDGKKLTPKSMNDCVDNLIYQVGLVPDENGDVIGYHVVNDIETNDIIKIKLSEGIKVSNINRAIYQHKNIFNDMKLTFVAYKFNIFKDIKLIRNGYVIITGGEIVNIHKL